MEEKEAPIPSNGNEKKQIADHSAEFPTRTALSLMTPSGKTLTDYGDEKEERERAPPWMRPLLVTTFFLPCKFHGGAVKNDCNMYCLICMGDALCSYCLVEHKDHPIVQIRRSSYHNGVRVSEVAKLIDLSGVQPYVINSAKIVFLNERAQPRQAKGVSFSCEICGRGLVDAFRFCSLGCKLRGINSDPNLSFTLRQKHSREYSNGDSSDEFPNTSVPTKNWISSSGVRVAARRRLLRNGEENSEVGGAARSRNYPPGTPINIHRSSRRKGIPRRAPF